MKNLISFMRKHQAGMMIISIAFIIYLLHAGIKSYWLDELYSVYFRGVYHETFKLHFANMLDANPVYPLYEFILYAWMRVFGDHEVATRFLSIVFVCISAFFLYLFSLRLFNKRIAITTLLFYLLSYSIIGQALNARFYGLMLMLSTLSSCILLRYAERLCVGFSWRNVFANKYFFMLTLVNMALLLNHTFSYLFLFVQALFVFSLVLSRKTTEPFYSKTLKVILIYLAPLLLLVVLWPPTITYFFNPESKLFLSEKLHTYVLDLMGKSSLVWIILFVLAGAAFLIITTKVLKRVAGGKTKALPNKKDSVLKPPYFWILGFITPLVVLFYSNFRVLGLNIRGSLDQPFEILFTKVIDRNISIPEFSYYILVPLMGWAVIMELRKLSHPQVITNVSLFTRKLFVVYLLLIVLLSPILTSLVYAFMHNYAFYPRYLIYCIPFFVLLLSLTIDWGIIAMLAIVKRFTRFSLKRIYLANTILVSVFFALILFGIKGYQQLTVVNHNDWRGISQQMVDIIEGDTLHKYIVVEAAIKDFPTLDYYLKRYSTNVRVGIVVQRLDKNRVARDKNYTSIFLNNHNKHLIEKHDYLIVSFIHPIKKRFPHFVNLLMQEYKLKIELMDDYNKGFMIFDVHHSPSGEIKG